jgi:hypothetical protein
MANRRGSYYKLLTRENEPTLHLNKALLEKMGERNKAELTPFDEKLKEAEEMEGETEIADILRDRAMYLTKIGDKVRSLLALTALKSNTISHSLGNSHLRPRSSALRHTQLGLQNRPNSHPRPNRLLLLLPSTNYFLPLLSRNAHRKRRRLGPSKLPESLQSITSHFVSSRKQQRRVSWER